jgi:hypothetical protein
MPFSLDTSVDEDQRERSRAGAHAAVDAPDYNRAEVQWRVLRPLSPSYITENFSEPPTANESQGIRNRRQVQNGRCEIYATRTTRE